MPSCAVSSAPWHTDEVFSRAFYAPYQSAAESALLALCAARCHLPEGSMLAVTCRLKTPASIRGKLAAKGLPITCEAAGTALSDIAGLRVVLSCEAEIYKTQRILCASPSLECFDQRDYIAAPKPSGYRSLHLLTRVPVCLRGAAMMVPVEIQLRTAEMDRWAVIEHDLVYKPIGRR